MFKSREVSQTPIYVITHSLLKSHFTHKFGDPLRRVVVGVVFNIGCLREKLIFSRGNYDTHSNKSKSDVSERILITKN